MIKNVFLSDVTSGVSEPVDRPMFDVLTKASVEFNGRLIVFHVLEQLSYLCRRVQRHRGYSMGLLSGNKSFEIDLKKSQSEIARRIQLIAAFSETASTYISKSDIERLYFAWNTVHDNWQSDSVIENFEFHCHLVDQLLLLINRLTEKIQVPFDKKIEALVNHGVNHVEPNEESLYYQLIYFCNRQVPRFIEMLGKIRALSVYAATTGYCQKDYGSKLSYLLQSVAQEKILVFELTDKLQQSIMAQLPSLLTIKTYEYKLDYLLKRVGNEIIDKDNVQIKEEEVFELATEIIDVYWRVVSDSLTLLHSWHKEGMEHWLKKA